MTNQSTNSSIINASKTLPIHRVSSSGSIQSAASTNSFSQQSNQFYLDTATKSMDYTQTNKKNANNENRDDNKDNNDIPIHHHHTAPSPSPNTHARIKQETVISEQKANHLLANSDTIDFLRIWIQREKQERDTAEVRTVCRKLQTACMMRDRWVYTDKNGHFPSCLVEDEDVCLNLNIVKNALPKKSNHAFEIKHGVFRVFKLDKKRRSKKQRKMSKTNEEEKKEKGSNNTLEMKARQSINTKENDESHTDDSDDEEKLQSKYEYVKSETPLYNVHSFGEFMKDLLFLMELMSNGPARTFCYQRLQTLQAKFKLHMLLNENNEMSETKRVPHRDFYNIRKVDNHVHHSACMTQKHLLRFIKSRLKHSGDEVVYRNGINGKEYSLKQLFKELNLTAYDLSIDTLSMHGHRDTFQRFDRFNNKYNPIGQSSLRQVFLKVDNYSKGVFLADLTKEVMDDLKESKYQYAEYRLSIYGKKNNEWDVLSEWICDNNLHCNNSRWMIQIPRLYAIYKAKGIISSFAEMLDNIFRPLFEVTIDPLSHPKLHLFLNLVTGFDTVDDESIRENTRYEMYPEPSEWTHAENPPYIVWSYYIYANLCILNQLRESRGMNAFSYRPHAGEAGDHDHVAAAFLLAQSINHGLTLKKTPVLQYLYYLKQIGLSMSPLSNNLLFIEYDRNPFNIFFQRGLNVTLSTDDPLIIHYTKDPLIEEYAIAAQVYKLSAIDMCEIARNSVLQSGFPDSKKKHWIGGNYQRRGAAGNAVKQTNVPEIRLLFRDELLAEEENWILGLPPPIFPTIKLNKHSKKHRKLSAKTIGHKKNAKQLRNHMNFLIAHRTKVPFNLHAANSPTNSMNQNPDGASMKSIESPDLLQHSGDKYDPLGYFQQEKDTKQGKETTDSKFYFDYNDKNIINESDYNLKKQMERNNDNGLVKDGLVLSKLKSPMTKQFVMVAIGLAIGYFVATMNNNRLSRKNEKNQK